MDDIEITITDPNQPMPDFSIDDETGKVIKPRTYSTKARSVQATLPDGTTTTAGSIRTVAKILGVPPAAVYRVLNNKNPKTKHQFTVKEVV